MASTSTSAAQPLSYVLVTPARNEARLIESTIQTVAAQTVLPRKWLIVSDGSTDGTDAIVQKYAAMYGWIELLAMPQRKERHFGGKALAFNAGLARLRDTAFDAVGCLDADITLQSEHFSYLLGKMAEDSGLGIVGAPNREASGEIYDFRYVSADEVSGTCQLFRRRCIEQIGGFVASRRGNIDTIACVMARMKGWKTRTFTGIVTSHNRIMGTAQCGPIRARYNEGVRDYVIGNHPLWQAFRVVYQMSKRPWLVRGLAMGTGFLWATLRRFERPVSRELIAFRRREEMQRLKKLFAGGRRPERVDASKAAGVAQ